MSCKLLTPQKLLEAVGQFPRSKKVVLCHGVFDIVHPGHIRHLSYAKSKADILVVSLTADKYITKGVYRPHVPENIRAESLAALEMVDYVIIDDNPTPFSIIESLKPDYFAKGFEYSDQHKQATSDEIKVVEGYGGEMLFTPGDVIYSSSSLLTDHLPNLQIEKLLNLMKQFGITFDALRKSLEQSKGFKVHIVGDTIVDTYTRTSLVGANAKTPTFTVLYQGFEHYVGGAAIVAQHLAAAGASVKFTTVIGDDELGHKSVLILEKSNISVEAYIDELRPTTHKNVIIAGETRLLKIDNVDNTPIGIKILKSMKKRIRELRPDCVMFSDFRHGIFSKSTIPELVASIPHGVLKVADSQVASRWGNITEFKDFDLITPNEKEARFALADQDSNIGRLITATKDEAKAKNIIMKLGSRGLFFLQDDSPWSLDSFAGDIKDAVGAGDALLAYATLTMLATKSLPMACIIGSIAAACECEVDGNMPITPEVVLTKLNKVEAMI